MAFYAHKHGQCRYRLSSHLALVAAGAARQTAGLPEARIRGHYEAAFLTGLAHDFGKYTSYFQDYLNSGVANSYKEHAFISALWAAFLGKEWGLPSRLHLLSFLSVLWHHRDLGDPEKYLLPRRKIEEDWAALGEDGRRLEVAQKQVEDLGKGKREVARSLRCAARWAGNLLARRGLPIPISSGYCWEEALEAFLTSWRDIYASLFQLYRQLRMQNDDLSPYFTMLKIFSSLIDADKLHAARLGEQERRFLPPEAVEIYKREMFNKREDSHLNLLRERIYQNVRDRVTRWGLEHRFFTLTAPTGSGKTLTALNAALLLRSQIKERHGALPRIVYALPFTSIIDQNHEVLAGVLERTLPDFKREPSPYLLKHHHLADVIYRTDEEEDLGFNEAALLIESWQSEIVITTFVQFLHTLIGYRNRMLKKFNRLSHAIIIMDEVQNIPVEYWPLLATILKEAADELGLRLLLMTATKPEWFSGGEALELAGDPEEVAGFFGALNRVRLQVDLTPRLVPEAADIFLRSYTPRKSYLITLNTIRSSIDFYQHLKTHLRNEAPLFYLSTNIVPAEREERLRTLKRLLEAGKKPLLVSTQVVEAGVDLDFDEVWRDIGPIDAVVQVAGRCNRHFKKEKGLVRLIKLVDEKGNTPAVRVYGNIHIHGAEKVFSQKEEMEEPDFFELVADYFHYVQERKDTSRSSGILRSMKALRFQKDREEKEHVVSDFRLIEERPDQVDVFVAVDEEAQEIWQRYRKEVVGVADIKERREAFYKIKRDFSRYLISVPAKLLLGKVEEKTKPLYIPRHFVPEVYDYETGFKRIEESMFIM